MANFYSPSENIAYPDGLMASYKEAGTLPDDLIKITDNAFQEYFIEPPPAGKYRAANNQGLPDWSDIPQLSHDELILHADQKKKLLIDAALQSISVIQLKLHAGRTLTDAETTRLNAALDYIDAVQAIDTSTAPDVNWPESPVA